MMMAEAGILVRAPLAQVREAVLDPDSYTRGDTKVGEVEVISRSAAGMVARIHGRLGPFRSAILARYEMSGEDVLLSMLEGRLRGFRAVFGMTPREEGTWLIHREEYDFGYGPLGPVLDRALRGWAQATVRAEVEALRRAAEARMRTREPARTAVGPAAHAALPGKED